MSHYFCPLDRFLWESFTKYKTDSLPHTHEVSHYLLKVRRDQDKRGIRYVVGTKLTVVKREETLLTTQVLILMSLNTHDENYVTQKL